MQVYCLVALTLILSAGRVSAGPLTVDILNTRYSTTVSNTDFLENGDPATTTRTRQSTSPLSDSLTPSYCCAVEASADLFALDLFALAMKADVAGFSESTFQPLATGVAAFAFDLALQAHSITYGQGAVSLFDLTTDQYVWSYAWGGEGFGNVPWVFGDPWHASWILPTLLSSGHYYQLALIGATQSSSDTEHLTMRVSGLHAVPEPATIFFVATGVGLIGARRRRLGR